MDMRGDTHTRLDEWLYLLLIFSLPLVRPFNLTAWGLLVPLADFIFIGAALAWLLALAHKKASFRRSWFYVPLALYLGAMITSTVASTVPRQSVIKLAGEAYLIGLSVLTFNLVRSESFMRRAMGAWLAGTALTAAVGLAGIFLFYLGVKSRALNVALSIYGSLPPGNYPRIQALFANPNMLCNFLNVSLMICLVTHTLGWLRPIWSRSLHAGIWVVSVFTLSPGLGGLALSAGLWEWARRKGTKHRRLGTLALAGGVLVAVAFFLAALVSPVTGGQGGLVLPVAGRSVEPSSRALAWQTALATFQQYPISGRGVGAEVSSVEYRNASGRLERLTDAHNSWLSIAGQEGLLGLAAFLTIVLYLFRNGDRYCEDDANVLIRRGLRAAFIGAFLYQSLTGSFEDARHIWVLIGLMAATRNGIYDSRGSGRQMPSA